KSGMGVVCTKPFSGDRMDHRKIYFFGTGDGHVIALTGGQGWCDKYAGPDWDNLTPVSEKDGSVLYPAGKEPWADHMRLLDGEGALQGAISFLGRYSTYANKGILKNGLGITDLSERKEICSRLWEMFYPELKPVGNLTAFISTNISWDQRPLTEEWYRNLSDPDVRNIRIAQPYITDPVVRTKLKQAVEAGKDIKILIPGQSDSFVSQYATKFLFADMAKIHDVLRSSGRPVGTLEFRQWQAADKSPQMLHMKYGIFIHTNEPQKDTVIDGSYNTTAVEARSGEVNSDIILLDHRAAVEAATIFDDYFNRAKPVDCSSLDKLKGAAAAVILRPFM
ncbi:MAG TPA: phospholipase D-like domain-containing protein, partial [Candidatus Ozemobacteraceae bacterium]|nr:phospholipase D-like domain-containing protein [Candidatus Ozemobacteraceae bacterium]